MKLFKYITGLFLLLTALTIVMPPVFSPAEKKDFSSNYRIPYELGEDYYLYSRYIETMAGEKSVMVLGDSVIWGHYVQHDQTLSARLNSIYGKNIFYNAGIDGIHPAAMKGLMEHYGKSVKNRKVIVGLNLLWMSSPRHDLTGARNDEINHRSLLSQFSDRIPAYGASVEDKVSNIINRNITFLGWINHIKKNFFKNESFYKWTLKNPIASPAEFFVKEKSKEYRIPASLPGKGIKQDVKWVNTEKSYQWKKIKELISLLKNGNNKIMVLMTPYNTASLTDKSLEKYNRIIEEIQKYFSDNSVAHTGPVKLDKKFFADASHPGAEGYTITAEEITRSREFTSFIQN